MSLSEMKKGQEAIVESIPEGEVRHQLLRFGIAPGTKVMCHARIPFGPIVLRFGGQEIAIGRGLAKSLKVRPGSLKKAE